MPEKRFRIAFSFASEKRSFVKTTADLLAARFGPDKILFDEYHQSEFAVYNLGIKLPKLYGEESDLIVPVLCPHYDAKLWTGWEWVHIYGLLTNQNGKLVMPCRFDYATADGLSPTCGFIELDQKSPEQFVTLILERLALNEGYPRDYYTQHATVAASTGESNTCAVPVLASRAAEDVAKPRGNITTEELGQGKVLPVNLRVQEQSSKLLGSSNPDSASSPITDPHLVNPAHVHTFSGLNCIYNQHPVPESSLLQDFVMSKGSQTRGVVNNPISKLWADADGSWIRAKVEKLHGLPVLTIEFTSRSKWPPNVAIHPQNLTPRKRTANQDKLFFLARRLDDNFDGGNLCISIRLIDENLRHWSYVESNINSDVLCKALGKNETWETVAIDLNSPRWKLWDSDGNRDNPPLSPEFKLIAGVVITVDLDKPNLDGNKTGKVQIAKLGFDLPSKPRATKPR